VAGESRRQVPFGTVPSSFEAPTGPYRKQEKLIPNSSGGNSLQGNSERAIAYIENEPQTVVSNIQ